MSVVEVNEKWTKRKTNKKSFVGVSRWGFCLRGGYWSFLNASICPVVYEILERLKEEYHFRKRAAKNIP